MVTQSKSMEVGSTPIPALPAGALERKTAQVDVRAILEQQGIYLSATTIDSMVEAAWQARAALHPPGDQPATAGAEPVTEFNVGRFCLSEDDCIAEGLHFGSYERGVADAAAAFARNKK